MPIITLPPPVPPYLPVVIEAGWVGLLAVTAALLTGLVAIAITRRANGRGQR